jgi:hypothetical protein
VFTGHLYQKTVELFGGAGVVTFRDLTTDEEVRVRGVFVKEAVADPMLFVTMTERALDLQLGLAVTALRTGSRTYTAPDPSAAGADPDELHRALRVWCVSDTLYRTVRWQYRAFLDALGVLARRALDASFYSATGPRGGSPASPPSV